jgi:hypothetical protein
VTPPVADENFEIRKKLTTGRFLSKLRRVKSWIEMHTGILLGETALQFSQSIADGVVLCKLLNVLYPGCIKTIALPGILKGHAYQVMLFFH